MTLFWWCIFGMTGLAVAILWIPVLAKVSALSKKHIRQMCCLSICFIAGAHLFYLKSNAHTLSALKSRVYLQSEKVQAQIKHMGSMGHIIRLLEQKIRMHPDAQGWFLLGKLYVKTQQFDKAQQAFETAHALAPSRSDILLYDAINRYERAKGVLTPKAHKLLQRVLILQPDSPDALMLLAKEASAKGHDALALMYWEKLLPFVPAGSDAQKTLLQKIATAQKHLKQTQHFREK